MACLAVLVWGCSDNGRSDPDAPVADARRTVLVYMAANNSLVGFAGYDLIEMREAVTRSGLNGCRVMVYLHTLSAPPILYELKEDGELYLARQYDAEKMAVDASRMSEVIADTKRLAPADDYGLVLWSHGSGWVDPPVSGDDGVIARSFGEDVVGGVRYGMKIPVLADVLRGQGFSFIYFDCCNMLTIEVAYELRDVADVIVGSPVELPGEGMPYDLNLPVFLADTPDLVEAAANTFDLYNGWDLNLYWCGMSVVYTAGLDRLADSTRRLFEACGPDAPARLQVQSLAYGKNSTLYDFRHYITEFNAPQYLLNDWVTSFNAVVKYSACTPTVQSSGYRIKVDHFGGLATYVLESPDDATRGYSSLQWWTDVAANLFESVK